MRPKAGLNKDDVHIRQVYLRRTSLFMLATTGQVKANVAAQVTMKKPPILYLIICASRMM